MSMRAIVAIIPLLSIINRVIANRIVVSNKHQVNEDLTPKLPQEDQEPLEGLIVSMTPINHNSRPVLLVLFIQHPSYPVLDLDGGKTVHMLEGALLDLRTQLPQVPKDIGTNLVSRNDGAVEGRICRPDRFRDGGLPHPRDPTSHPDGGSPIIGFLIYHRGSEGSGPQTKSTTDSGHHVVKTRKNFHFEKI